MATIDRNGMMGSPMGAEPPMAQPMMNTEDAILNMHLTDDVKQALQAKGIDISAVASMGPKEPVIVLPVSVIQQRYPADSPEDSMRQFVEDMTSAQQPVSAEQPMVVPAEAPAPEGLGAPMNRPPMTA